MTAPRGAGPAGAARAGDPRGASRARLADAEIPGWAGGVMAVLRWATLLVEVNAMVLLGTLAGGVVLGLGPALRAGSAVARRMTDEPTPWRTFWRTWRAGFRRTNLLFAPFWPIAVVGWYDGVAVTLLDGPVLVVLQTGLLAVATWCAVMALYWPRVTLRYDRGVRDTWRFLLLVPLLGPATSLSLVVVLAATAAGVWALPLLAPLVGLAVPLWASGRLVDDRLDRIDARPS